MFALFAVICFGIALVVDHLGPINLVVLGLFLIALHLLTGVGWPWARRNP